MPTTHRMTQARTEDLVIGVLFLALGAYQAIRARAARDWSVRVMQRDGYLILIRALGVLIALLGIVILVAWWRGVAL